MIFSRPAPFRRPFARHRITRCLLALSLIAGVPAIVALPQIARGQEAEEKAAEEKAAKDKAAEAKALEEAEKARKAEAVKEDAEKEDAKKDDAEKEDAKNDDAEKEDAKKDDAEKEDAEKEDAEKEDAKTEAQEAEKVKAGLLEILRQKKAEKAPVGEATAAAPAAAPTAKLDPAPADHGEEASTEAQEDAAGETAPAPKKKKEPLPPMFWLRDSTRLAGIPKIATIHVETAYGQLAIPVAEVEMVRFAEGKRQELGGRIVDLITQLGHEEFDLREQAMEEIRKIGAAAVPALQKAKDSEDEEIKSRVEKLVEELEEEEDDVDEAEVHTVPLKGEEDEIVTRQFTARGRVLEESFTVDTKYGELVFHRKDIVSVVFREPLIRKETFTVQGSMIAGQNRWLDTNIDLEKDRPFEVTASGSVQLPNFGNVAATPEGTTNAPSRWENHPAGALVAKVGDGKAFLVGSEYAGKAPAKGRLFLGLALQSNNGNGSFEVEVKVPNE